MCGRTKDTLDQAAYELRENHGAQVLPFIADIMDRHSVDSFTNHVAETFGRIDILVNKAGESEQHKSDKIIRPVLSEDPVGAEDLPPSRFADMDDADFVQDSSDGMRDQLDSHSQFYDEAGMRQLRQDTTGKYAGLGITVAIKDSFPIIISTMEDTPAWKAGIRSGDLIVSIEGLKTKNKSLDKIVHELRGDPGSVVKISLVSKLGAPERSMVIKRELIQIYSVAYVDVTEKNIGYISLRETRFSETTANEVKAAVKKLLERGAKSLILDLRGNPGGLLNQATQVADVFLPKGAPIVSIRERDGRNMDVKRSKSVMISEDVPLVVLIDESSASASEIVAGAIQDNDCGVILGTTSFGKGSVQTIFDLNESIASALKLTTALYYSPSGRSIHRDLTGFNRSPEYIVLGDNQISSKALLAVLGKAQNEQAALLSIQLLFGLDASTAQNLLSMKMRDLINLKDVGTDGEMLSTSRSDSVSVSYTHLTLPTNREV